MRLFVKESAQGTSLNSPESVVESVQSIKNADQEVMLLIGFNAKNREIHREVLFKGGGSACMVDFKTLFCHVLRKGCDGFVLAHNHPSGDCKPSQHDQLLTQDLVMVSGLIDLRFNDHIIVGGDSYYMRIPAMGTTYSGAWGPVIPDHGDHLSSPIGAKRRWFV